MSPKDTQKQVNSEHLNMQQVIERKTFSNEALTCY